MHQILHVLRGLFLTLQKTLSSSLRKRCYNIINSKTRPRRTRKPKQFISKVILSAVQSIRLFFFFFCMQTTILLSHPWLHLTKIQRYKRGIKAFCTFYCCPHQIAGAKMNTPCKSPIQSSLLLLKALLLRRQDIENWWLLVNFWNTLGSNMTSGIQVSSMYFCQVQQ